MLSARGITELPPEVQARAAEILGKKKAETGFTDMLRAFSAVGRSSLNSLGTKGRPGARAGAEQAKAEAGMYWSGGAPTARHAVNMAAQREVLPLAADALLLQAGGGGDVSDATAMGRALTQYAPGAFALRRLAQYTTLQGAWGPGVVGFVVPMAGSKLKKKRFCAITKHSRQTYLLDPADDRKLLRPLTAPEFKKAVTAKPSGPGQYPMALVDLESARAAASAAPKQAPPPRGAIPGKTSLAPGAPILPKANPRSVWRRCAAL